MVKSGTSWIGGNHANPIELAELILMYSLVVDYDSKQYNEEDFLFLMLWSLTIIFQITSLQVNKAFAIFCCAQCPVKLKNRENGLNFVNPEK